MIALQTDIRITASCTELSSLYKDFPFAVRPTQFETSLLNFSNEIKNPLLKINFCTFSEIETARQTKFSTSIIGRVNIENSESNFISTRSFGQAIELKYSSVDSLLNHSVGDRKQEIIFILFDKTSILENDLERLSAYIADYFYIIFIFESGVEGSIDFKNIPSNYLISETFQEDIFTSINFFERFSKTEFNQLLNSIYNLNCQKAIESLYNNYNALVEQEIRNIRAKKAVGQQQLIKMQGDNVSNLSDSLQQVRNDFNNQFALLEKGISEHFENFIRPQTGQLSAFLDKELSNLTLETSEKSKTNSLTIPVNFESNFFLAVHNVFLQIGHNQLKSIADSFKVFQEELEEFYQSKNILAHSMDLKLLTDEPLQRLLNSAVRTEKQYEGSSPKKNLMEFFMASRQIYMLLFMIASTFGISRYARVDVFKTIRDPQDNSKLKEIYNDKFTIFLAVTILLIGAGVYVVYNTSKKEEKEIKEKEIQKAKEFLVSEVRRIIMEIQRPWMKIISDHLKNQQAMNLNNIEINFKNMLQSNQSSFEKEKNKVQKQNQGLDNAERVISNMSLKRDNFIRNSQKNILELKQQVVLNLKKTI
jgi:hypothetical protein